MTRVFASLINLCPIISVMIIAVIAIRSVFVNVPKRIYKILWFIIGIRCCLPFSLSSTIGVLPDKIVPYTLTNQGIKSTGLTRPDIPIPASNGAVNVNKGLSIEAIIPYIWIVGIMFFGIYILSGYIRVRRLVADSIPYEKNIYTADRIASPFVIGIFRPRIYIKNGMEKSKQDLIIAHEQCHIKNHDNLFKLVSFIILGVYWFNPLVWVAYIIFCKDIELACDEEVIRLLPMEKRKNYAIALLESSHKNRTFAYGTGFSENNTKERIKRVMNYRKPKVYVVSAAVIICMLFLAVFFTVNKKSSVAQNIDFITYEFETYDGKSVVVNADNIVKQEKTDNPEESDLISEAAAGNIIAPGRDYIYLEDEKYYYVADYYNGFITVAEKTATEGTAIADNVENEEGAEASVEEDVLDDNPGFFETEDISLKYDVAKFYGFNDGDATVLNSLNAVAGTSLIQITKTDFASIDEALANLESSSVFELSAVGKFDFNGYNAVGTAHIIPDDQEGVKIDDYYTIVEANGKIFVIDEMITRDPDTERGETLRKEFSAALKELKFK